MGWGFLEKLVCFGTHKGQFLFSGYGALGGFFSSETPGFLELGSLSGRSETGGAFFYIGDGIWLGWAMLGRRGFFFFFFNIYIIWL